METIYRVEYSEEAGYFVRVLDGVASWGIGSGAWSVQDRRSGREPFHYSEGWRSTEEEAIESWREEGRRHAESLRRLAQRVEDVAENKTPVRLPPPVLMPSMDDLS